MLSLEYLNDERFKQEIATYAQSIKYLDIHKIKYADWSDRRRFDGNISFDEIALYLLSIGEYDNQEKIAHLKEAHQKTIRGRIDKYLKQFPIYYEKKRVEELINSEDFKEYKRTFRQNSDRVDWLDEVDNFNDYINYRGKKDSNIEITADELQDIKYMAYTLYRLECVGIDANTYNSKVTKYLDFIKKGSEEFGLLISDDIPFSNPRKLSVLMDAKLTKAGLSNKQRTTFYRDFNIRDRIPDQKLVRQRVYDDMVRDLGDKFRTLPKEDQTAAQYLHPEIESLFVLDDEDALMKYENHIFSSEYYAILEEYSLKEFPFEAIDPHYAINTENNLTENPWEINGLDYNNKEYLLNKKIEHADTINSIEKLDQTKYALLRHEHISLDYTKYKEIEEKYQQEVEDEIADICDDSHLLNP
ncbi:hypothetical protein [Sulfurimonas sp. NW9]|uniref:hypothetical protein n=1 Tax=Sulfurimonas sp. NW9 TaxID=2922728 RepID=UPI003DAA4765